MTTMFPMALTGSPVGVSLGSMLARALSGQKTLYTQILTLCRQQTEFVRTGDTEGLMEVLAARGRIIEQVTPLDRELQPYKGRWQQVLDGLPQADRAVVGGLLMEVQKLLADILSADESDKDALVRQKNAVAADITRAVSGAALNRAYGVKGRN